MHWNRWTIAACGLAAMAGCVGPKSRERSGDSANASVGSTELQVAAMTPPSSAELAAAGPFLRTTSGLKYRVLRAGTGRKPRSTDSVRAHYHGWLDDGSVFDSSFERGSPASFSLQNVVPGWTEGLQYIGQGGRIELEIPSFLGYGAEGRPGKIPPNSTLHFVVELLEVE